MSQFSDFLQQHQGELAFAGGVLTFGWGVAQYVRAQRWQSAEFALGEMQSLVESAHAKIVFRMLDYNVYTLEFNHEGDAYEIGMNDAMLTWIMRPHTVDGNLTDEEVAIRDMFDKFFLDLEKIEYLVSIGMIKPRALRPYLYYWLNLLGNKKSNRKPAVLVQALHNYLHFYKQEGVIRLLRRYGFWALYDAKLRYVRPAANENTEQ